MDITVFRSTFDSLRRVVGGLAGSLREAERPLQLKTDLPLEDAQRVRSLMRDCLEARGGEVSARLRAARLGEAYLTLDDVGRRRFLEILARDFAVEDESIEEAVERWRRAEEPAGRIAAEEALRAALVSPRLRLLKQFNALPQGVKFLVDLRADLLAHIDDPVMKGLDRELKQLLETWFDVGFLELSHITWDSPAALLEKLIAYEAVHEINSWQDLRNRLESDRRCYAFFHPGMPEEPLIFVEVALVSGIAGSIQTLLDEAIPQMDPEQADTAIFYSISNTQKGLRGISFGNFLIKRVADHLSHEFPTIRTFATLSPIPGFASWLRKRLDEGEDAQEWADLRETVDAAAGRLEASGAPGEFLFGVDWARDEAAAEALREPMERLCARYLHEQRENGTPIDPVERFHLGNGARIERLNWLGDTSPKGMEQSCGLMVNYLYRLEEIEKNHERYVADGVIASSSQTASLLRPPTRENGRGPLVRILPGK